MGFTSLCFVLCASMYGVWCPWLIRSGEQEFEDLSQSRRHKSGPNQAPRVGGVLFSAANRSVSTMGTHKIT